jgi:hypothetical protein
MQQQHTKQKTQCNSRQRKAKTQHDSSTKSKQLKALAAKKANSTLQ